MCLFTKIGCRCLIRLSMNIKSTNVTPILALIRCFNQTVLELNIHISQNCFIAASYQTTLYRNCFFLHNQIPITSSTEIFTCVAFGRLISLLKYPNNVFCQIVRISHEAEEKDLAAQHGNLKVERSNTENGGRRRTLSCSYPSLHRSLII